MHSQPLPVPMVRTVSMRLEWPPALPAPLREDFFWGAWHPTAEILVTVPPAAQGIASRQEKGANWLALSNTSAMISGSPGLVHRFPGSPSAVVFRGYIADAPLHSWSDSRQVCRYWQDSPTREHNGVFAAVRIFADRLELITDAFGISPLYHRTLSDGTVLFASSPRYLRIAGDAAPDPVAARMIMHRGGLCGDVSLVPGVRRSTPGHVLTFTAGGLREEPWFPFGSLPQGVEPLTDKAIAESEEAFQAAMERCLRLMPEGLQMLPLSSGNDSRRILAALHSRSVPFQALTVRIFQKDNRDLDARFAAQMAAELGFPHRIFEYASPDQYRLDDITCRRLFSSEVSDHTWMLSMLRNMPNQAGVVFDGLAGDVVGNTGWAIPEHYSITDESRKMEAILAEALPPHSGLLREDQWAPLEAARHEFVQQVKRLVPEGISRSDYAFMLTRVRRGTGTWGQHLLRPGHLVVHPYCDLEHVRVTMRFNPLQKLEQNLTRTIQIRCLERFWPRYYAFAGSRRIPSSVLPEPTPVVDRLRIARLDQLRSECQQPLLLPGIYNKVPLKRYVQALIAQTSDQRKLSARWWMDPLLMLESFTSGQTASHFITQPAGPLT